MGKAMKTKVKLSELLEKLYCGDYLSDDEYNMYVRLLKMAREKEKHESTKR